MEQALKHGMRVCPFLGKIALSELPQGSSQMVAMARGCPIMARALATRSAGLSTVTAAEVAPIIEDSVSFLSFFFLSFFCFCLFVCLFVFFTFLPFLLFFVNRHDLTLFAHYLPPVCPPCMNFTIAI